MNEHVKEQISSHLTDVTKEFGALRTEEPGLQAPRSRSRRTRSGVEAQEQASEEELLTNLATLCQQQQTEIDGLRRLVNELTGGAASRDVRLDNLEKVCQQQQTEIVAQRSFLISMGGLVERRRNVLARDFVALKGQVEGLEGRFEELARRLVRCYAIAQ